MFGERIANWLELHFWLLAVRLLSFSRPISHHLLRSVQQVENKGLAPSSFPRDLFTAICGWAIGLLLGYLLTQLRK